MLPSQELHHNSHSSRIWNKLKIMKLLQPEKSFNYWIQAKYQHLISQKKPRSYWQQETKSKTNNETKKEKQYSSISVLDSMQLGKETIIINIFCKMDSLVFLRKQIHRLYLISQQKIWRFFNSKNNIPESLFKHVRVHKLRNLKQVKQSTMICKQYLVQLPLLQNMLRWFNKLSTPCRQFWDLGYLQRKQF